MFMIFNKCIYYHVCCTSTIAWYIIHCTYMVQTCLYTFMPGGQDSRCDCDAHPSQVQLCHMTRIFLLRPGLDRLRPVGPGPGVVN